jgi:hypothetical protein
MNFARLKCDECAVQSLMRNDAFALQVRNERRCFGIRLGTGRYRCVGADLSSTVTRGMIPGSLDSGPSSSRHCRLETCRAKLPVTSTKREVPTPFVLWFLVGWFPVGF